MKIHTVRKLEVRKGSEGALVVEIVVWRPIGSFQVKLEKAEVARYGKAEALDRCLRKTGQYNDDSTSAKI